MSTEMITAPVAQDVADNLALIARSPSEMRTAQESLSLWFANKIAILARDAAEAQANATIAADNGWKASGFDNAWRRILRRVEFYKKCKAAVDAGYCIVPNFPVETFAIRTKRKSPPDSSEYKWQGDAAKIRESESPKLGDGRYVDSEPLLSSRWHDVKDQKTGLIETVNRYWASHWADEIDFPVSIAKPEIMSAAAEAMAVKCFDELGVLPGTRRAKGDPIIVGMIRDPRSTTYNKKMISFLIAWYVNTAEL